jgi:hypothetical protein
MRTKGGQNWYQSIHYDVGTLLPVNVLYLAPLSREEHICFQPL